MFRISQYLGELAQWSVQGRPPETRRRGAGAPPGPVVIWNLIRRCNLTCKHCYAFSADHDYPGELSTAEAFSVMDDLNAFGVPALILSGGEPLLRPDLFTIAERALAMGFYTGLSSNGTLIDEPLAERIARTGFQYVGISLDGLKETHDAFRRCTGAFDRSWAAIQHLQARGVKVGLRFTLTSLNAHDLPAMLDLMAQAQVPKFYFSHLNYAGRGNVHRAKDAQFHSTRWAMDLLFERAWSDALRCAQARAAESGEGGACGGGERAEPMEFVSGNNDADGPYLWHWVRRRWPERTDWHAHLATRLHAWRGNASGLHVANIDNVGQVHPDTMWWHHPLGNVRERPFSVIWQDTRDPLMAGLKQQPRPVQGRCAHCVHLGMCGGNSRVRAQQLTGNPWAEDPGCYLDDLEIAAPHEECVA